MRRLITLLFLFFASLNCSFAQNPSEKNIVKSIDSLLRQKYTEIDPGVSVLVAQKGKIIYKNAFGNANLELNVPMKTDMLFNLGSITKQFTAVAILQLVEKAKLSLQDSIQQYIPDFPLKGHTITIENLLTHTSGLKDYLQIDYKESYMERKDFTPKELINYFKDSPLDFEPGSSYRYSNTGYFLLGYIIEKVTGKTYEQYLQDHIFNVLGLSHTYYDNAYTVLPNRTNGYKKSARYEKADYWGASIPYAAGALISNVDDLYQWHKGLYTYRMLKKETLEKATTAFNLRNGVKVNYGYGWIVNDQNGIIAISHGGKITGYRTNEIYYPKEDVFIVILTNCDCAPLEDLSAAISTIALGKPLQESIKLDASILSRYIGVYELSTNPKRKIKIIKEKEGLIAETSENQKYPLIFRAEQKFELKDILDAKCEFIIENNKVSKLIITQNGIFEWKKME